MKSMQEIFNNLDELGALTKGGFVKAAIKNGNSKDEAAVFWDEKQTSNATKRDGHNDELIELFVGGPTSESDLFNKIIELDKTGPAQWVGYWNRVRVGFNKVWERAGSENLAPHPATESQRKLVRELATRNKGK